MLAGEFIASVYLKLGDIDRFVAQSIRGATVYGASKAALASLQQVTAGMQRVHATEGLAGVSRFMADQIGSERVDFDAVLKMAFGRAVLYGAAGRLDEAFECLDQAIAFRDPAMVHLAVAPQWDPLRGDPRFVARLRAMSLPGAA